MERMHCKFRRLGTWGGGAGRGGRKCKGTQKKTQQHANPGYRVVVLFSIPVYILKYFIKWMNIIKYSNFNYIHFLYIIEKRLKKLTMAKNNFLFSSYKALYILSRNKYLILF